ncbi:MAG: hypothetical protein F6K11_26710 [Leptolyngbya sp. SIO3F4]|nr:hypothetical protein [Leptolyngbya sp. SIO3F4]
MKLAPNDVQLFFSLMLPLQWYVSQQASLLPDIKTFEAYTDSSMDDKIIVRDYIFEHPELIDQFIQDNPENLETDKLNIIATWKNFIRGDFFIERLLKKYSIFIDDKENVYAILGLMEGLDVFMDKRDLPVRVQTILLPFKGKIVYDGFFRWYRMFFGSGIKSSLKQTYLIAKDNNAIIDTLEPDAATTQTKSKKTLKQSNATQDWGPLLDELAEKAKKLRGGGGQPATYSPIFSLVRASIEMAQLATANSPDIDKLCKKGARLDTLIQQVENALLRNI